jgi:golgin subfamily B member 1
MKHWLVGAEHTACRAALLISGDLETAKKLLSTEAQTPEVSAADKMKDLLVFSVSPDYAALRRALGVNIPAE